MMEDIFYDVRVYTLVCMCMYVYKLYVHIQLWVCKQVDLANYFCKPYACIHIYASVCMYMCVHDDILASSEDRTSNLG